MQPRLPSDSYHAKAAARRMREIAQAALIAWLAMGAAACSSSGNDNDEGYGPGKTKLPVPAEFRAKLWQLTNEKKWFDATDFLNANDPALLARASSENADIQYFVIMGIGPVTPGIPPKPRPAR